MTWHHWTVKKFLPLFIPRFHRRPVICFHANRDTNCKGRREKKGARGKSAHCTVAEQTFKGLLPGMRGGGGGDGDDVGGTVEGEKPLLDVEEEACRQRKDPSLSPSLSLFLSLSIPPPCLFDAAEEKPHPFHHGQPHKEKPSVSLSAPPHLPLPERRHAPLKC